MSASHRFALSFCLGFLALSSDGAAQCSGGGPQSAPGPGTITPPGWGQRNPGPGDTTPRNPGGPASPGAPGPRAPGGGPSTGGPGGGPRTGGPTGGGLAGPPTGGGGGPMTGAPIVFERGESSEDALEIDWKFPTPKNATGQALSRDKAFEEIIGSDPRPLLIVRECDKCQGTERALLNAHKNNERIQLMTRWFHCVRLPNHVWDPTHPFFHVFDGMGDAHLFLTTRDLELSIPFNGVQTQSVLWKGMRKVLAAEYRKDSKSAVTKLVKHLDTYDKLDAKVKDALAQFDRALENHGPKSSRYKKAKKRLDKERAALAVAKKRERKLSDLVLKSGVGVLDTKPKKD